MTPPTLPIKNLALILDNQSEYLDSACHPEPPAAPRVIEASG